MTSVLTKSVAAAILAGALVACGSEDGVDRGDGAVAPSAAIASAAAPDGLQRAPDLATANSRSDLNVVVVAQQWSWTFSYTKGGTTVEEPVWEGGPGRDAPTLWLVADKSVTFSLYSPDVIHSFWPTDFLFKMDVVPGRAASNYFTVTPDRRGTHVGRCAELCGAGHSRMLFRVNVVSQAEFDTHLAELEAAGRTGLKVPAGYQDEISAG